MVKEIIIPQVSVPKVDVLIDQHGIYKVYLDMISQRPLDIPSIDFLPPSTALPQIFTDLNSIQFQYPGAKINLVGKPLSANDTKIAANSPTQKEVNDYMKTGKLKKVASSTIRENPHEEDVDLFSEPDFKSDSDSLSERECIFLFREKSLMLQDKRKKGAKDYLNGMAFMILKLYPNLKQQLLDSLKEGKESDNLF